MWGLPPSLTYMLASPNVQITHLSAPTLSVVFVWLIVCGAGQTPSQKKRMTCAHLPPSPGTLSSPRSTPSSLYFPSCAAAAFLQGSALEPNGSFTENGRVSK